MPRLNKVEIETAEGKAKELLEAINNKLGKVPNIFKGMANSPAAFENYLASSEILASGELSGQEREAIALVIAETNDCKYCLSAHTAIAAREGISSEEALMLRQAQSSDDKLATLVTFAKKIMTTKGYVEDADLEAIRAAGYNDAQIAEIVALVALNVFTNFFNHVNASENDFPEVKSI